MASLTRLGTYATLSKWVSAAWLPDGRLALVSWCEGGESAHLWDLSRPEAPSVVTVDFDLNTRFHSWSPGGASYFRIFRIVGNGPASLDHPDGPVTFELEERRAAGGTLLRAVVLGPTEGHFPDVSMSPDSNALVLHYCNRIPPANDRDAHVIVFD